MDRMACVNLPALPLQVLLRDRPAWRGHPAAVVDRDKPSGTILWVNDEAHARRIFPGQRYGAALGLDRTLRAGVVDAARLEAEIKTLTEALWRFSPRIEPSKREPGVFWLDASGLQFLFPSLARWAEAVHADLRGNSYHANIAAGFSRFGAYAAAKITDKLLVFDSPAHEQTYIRRAPLTRLGFEPSLVFTLRKLGVETLGGFIALPPEGIWKRFGRDAHEWHQLARGDGWRPLAPEAPAALAERRIELDYPEAARARLMTLIEPALRELLEELASRYEAATAIELELTLNNKERRDERIAPAAPTRDAAQLLHLLELRIQNIELAAGVEVLVLRLLSVSASEYQQDLLQTAPRRNMEAVQRAFAKIRAEWGDGAVVRARLNEGHLPEARFAWERFEAMPPAPRAASAESHPLIRRIFAPALELPPRPRQEPDGWLVAGVAEGPVEEVIGPHIVSGGWWTREIARAYYYVRTRSGRWLWIYHDQKRRRWYLQGEVE